MLPHPNAQWGGEGVGRIGKRVLALNVWVMHIYIFWITLLFLPNRMHIVHKINKIVECCSGHEGMTTSDVAYHTILIDPVEVTKRLLLSKPIFITRGQNTTSVLPLDPTLPHVVKLGHPHQPISWENCDFATKSLAVSTSQGSWQCSTSWEI